MQTMWDYLIGLGRRITRDAFSDIHSLDDWQAARDERRREFFEMVGLDPLPARSPLNPREMGCTKGDGYTVHRLSIESLPKVYVTCNLYVPDGIEQPAPAVLNVCGHNLIGTMGYQAHGIMWAKRGYVCLVQDTLEQNDSLGDHHGLWGEQHYDWICRGYAASGGELWNSIRALDYLCGREEVDASRVGVTGISGGGALSWWVGIADERVRAVAPFCGTSSLASHLAERTINGHCDCMVYHNLYQRAMSEVGALCAPRPLLVGCAREDSLFSPEGYRTVVDQVRGIYELYGVPENCQLCEYPGPHSYQPEAHEAARQWFEKHVAGEETPAVGFGEPAHKERELTVFGGAPPSDDQIALMPILLSRPGRIAHADSIEQWERTRRETIAALQAKVFQHFPSEPCSLDPRLVGDWLYGTDTRLLVYDFTTEDDIRLRVRIVLPEEGADSILVGLMQPEDRAERFEGALRTVAGPHAICVVEPRGAGPTSWHPSQDWQILRGGMLVGLTPHSMQLWDLLRAVRLVRELPETTGKDIYTYGVGQSGALALYAAALDEQIAGAVADQPPASHVDGPYLLNVLRVLDVPQAAGLVAPRKVGLVNAPSRAFHWTQRLYERLGIDDQLVAGSAARHVFGKLSATG